MTDSLSPDLVAGDRYTRLRAMLAKNAPLSLEQYLAAQQVFLLMDLHAEIAGLREELALLCDEMRDVRLSK